MQPVLTLLEGRVLVDTSQGAGLTFDERTLPLAKLQFDYDGVRVDCTDARPTFFRANGTSLEQTERDSRQERALQARLESFGLIDLETVSASALSPGTAHFAVHLEADLQAIARLESTLIPTLRDEGWIVQHDPSFHWRTHGDAEPEVEVQEDVGWFELGLGIDVDGERVDLLPILQEVLSQSFHGDIDSMARMARVALPLGGGRYVSMDGARVGAILRVVQQLHREQGGVTLKLAPSQIVLLEPLVSACPPGAWRGDPNAKERIAALGRAPIALTEGATKGAVRATLRPYQLEGVAWLRRLRSLGLGGILADDMGLGKTLQTITHLAMDRLANPHRGPALVVAPTSLLGNWQRELQRFAPWLRVVLMRGAKRHQAFGSLNERDVVLTTYALLYRDLDAYGDFAFSTMVMDEAQAIKNHRSQAHGACASIRAEQRIALTGTPVENHLGELWSICEVTNPGYLGNQDSFGQTYRQPIEQEGHAGRLEQLRQRVAPILLRRMKRDVAPELPEKTEVVRDVELEGPQRDLYETIRLAVSSQVQDIIRERGFEQSKLDVLDALLKLRQVCCDPRLLRLDVPTQSVPSAKLTHLCDMVEELRAQHRRVLVFSQFTSMLQLIAAALQERDHPFTMLTGETADRDAAVRAFQEGSAEVFLLSLKAGGTGLNLTRADTVVHFEPWWNPAIVAQASDRAYRIGQDKPVFVYHLVVAGSVESRMVQLQKRKRALSDAILAGSAGGDTALTRADVSSLLSPLDEGDDTRSAPRDRVVRGQAVRAVKTFS